MERQRPEFVGDAQMALFHTVQGKELLSRARGDESSPFFGLGNEALATAHDEARALGIDPNAMDLRADEVIQRFEDMKLMGEHPPLPY